MAGAFGIALGLRRTQCRFGAFRSLGLLAQTPGRHPALRLRLGGGFLTGLRIAFFAFGFFAFGFFAFFAFGFFAFFAFGFFAFAFVLGRFIVRLVGRFVLTFQTIAHLLVGAIAGVVMHRGVLAKCRAEYFVFGRVNGFPQ
ncbi:MAG TPA: hypothetical protein VGG61_01190 [Gemmataceae bacterium]